MIPSSPLYVEPHLVVLQEQYFHHSEEDARPIDSLQELSVRYWSVPSDQYISDLR